MLERLREALRDESYTVVDEYDGERIHVVEFDSVDSILKEHDYLPLDSFLKILLPHQIIAIRTGTSLVNYDYLGTADFALNGGIKEAFKNISGCPLEMSVSKVDVRTEFHTIEGNDTPVLFIFVN